MRSTTCFALFAAGAVAQQSASILDIFQFAETITQIGADATATTYINKCPPGKTGLSAIPTGVFDDPITSSATPTPTGAARFRRQASSSASDEDYSLCEELTLRQGPSTYGFAFTDPEAGAWTMSADCNFSGDIKTADVTCTADIAGSYPESIGNAGKTTEVLFASDAASFSYYRAIAVVTSSGSASGSASGSGSVKPSGSQSGSTPSGTVAQVSSTGLAAAGPMPTGALAYGLGAAGVFAAALAL